MRILSVVFILMTLAGSVNASSEIALHARSRRESAKGKGDWIARQEERRIDLGKTAIIVCDVWNEHWCKGATKRVAEMAPRMNDVLVACRAKGALVIHAPSGTMKAYEGTPQRERARSAPAAKPPVEIKGWNYLDPASEGPLPIDDSDGGCDEDPPCKQGPPYPWTSQHPALKIADPDAVSDSGPEIYNLLAARGIDTVVFLGVHANMCVLGRPFGIRQMVRMGKNVYLIRDLTDTMYNSRKRPFVAHEKGTELVIEHVEKYWCPTILSEELLK
jgi:nicotinamidase-related amidase